MTQSAGDGGYRFFDGGQGAGARKRAEFAQL